MPADRIIKVEVATVGMRDQHGRYVPGATTTIRTWCFKHDLSLEDIVEAGGNRDATNRRWRVRFDSRIYGTATSLIKVVDGGVDFSIESMNEITDQGAQPPSLAPTLD